MEYVFPIEVNIPSASLWANKAKVFLPIGSIKVGVVEKVIEPGRFIVSFADGVKVRVHGSDGLKLGSRVQVQFSLNRLQGPEGVLGVEKLGPQEKSGFQMSALLPLAFGGKGANARLQVIIERQSTSALDKFIPAIYFVFLVQTKELGEIQWSIHMKGHQVSIQVFAPGAQKLPEKLRLLTLEVEKGLKNRGFVLYSPTVYLNHRFKVPSGFRLNVRG